MARKYSQIENYLWLDPDYRNLDLMTQHLWVYLLSSPQLKNIPGLIILSPAIISDEMGRDVVEEVIPSLDILIEKGWVKIDKKARVVLLPGALVHNPPRSENEVKGWVKDFKEIPDSYLKDEWVQTLVESSKVLDSTVANAVASGFGGYYKGIPRVSGQGVAPNPDPIPHPNPKEIYVSGNQNNKTPKVEVETDNTSRVVKSSTLSPAPSVPYEGEQKNDSQRMVALIMSLWDNWPQDQVEPTVMKLRSADMNLSFSQWEEIIREAFRTCEPTKPTNQLHSWLARQVTFWKGNKSRQKKQQARSNGDYTPRRKPIYPPDCDRSMSSLKEMWVPKGMTAWQDGARTVEENLEICYGPDGFSASTPKAHVDRIRAVIDAHKAAGLTMELEYEECD